MEQHYAGCRSAKITHDFSSSLPGCQTVSASKDEFEEFATVYFGNFLLYLYRAARPGKIKFYNFKLGSFISKNYEISFITQSACTGKSTLCLLYFMPWHNRL
jgi:hypothetical protein